MSRRRVLMVSPHLDDAVFSAGGIAATLAVAGVEVVIVTAFTRSVLPATGFALACQLDKGLSADVDYMALRRAEDVQALQALGVAKPVWLDLPEAPHRGYETAAALFGKVLEHDTIAAELACLLRPLVDRADVVLAPQGLGGHVDHRCVIQGLLHLAPRSIGWWEDTPYIIRDPDGCSDVSVPTATRMSVFALSQHALDRKIAASCAYASQIGFQFGGQLETAAALTELAQRLGGERLLLSADAEVSSSFVNKRTKKLYT